MTTNNLQKNKKIITISLLLLSLLILFCFSMDSASAAEWTVGPDGTYDYNSIQEAIDDTNTQPGDTITVDPNGTDSYQENVVVNKNNLSIQSNGAVTVSGSNPNSPVININSQGSLSRVTGFTLTGSSGSTGVKIDGASDVTISHLVIENCVCGVDITGNCNNIQIESVTIDSPTTNGIYVRGNVNNLVITGTTTNPTSITGTTTGIEKYYGSQINGLTIENTNIINPNVYGIYINDSTDWGGWTKNLLIQNVNVSGAGSTGIYINMATTQSENIEITQTTVTGGNNHGIYMSARGGNINIHNNPSSFSNNTGWGLYIYGYDNPTLTLTQNRIENNGNGLYLRGISNLTLPGDNTIINNGGINYQLVDCNNITLENTSFNNTVRNYNTAVNASNCNNLILQNLTISNNRLVAIFVGGTDVILRDITINNSTGTSIQLQGTSYNMLMEHLTINEPATVGIDIAGNVYTNNSEPALKITSNSNGPTTINQGHNHGISKGRDYQVNGLTIENTTINTTSGNGISVYDVSGYGGWTQNLIIKNVTITGSGSHGIYVRPLNPTSQNIEITQTSVTGRNGDGVHVEGRGNINIHDNSSSFSNNTGWGLYIYGYDNPNTTLTQNRIENNGNGLYLRGISNLTLPGDNTIINNGGINYQLVNCNNITLENTSFNNTVRAYNTAINALNCNNLLLQNLTVSNNSGTAILVGGNDVILRDITINNSTGTSVQVQGTSYNMLMEHLTINQPTTVGIDIAGQVYTNTTEPALKITSNSNGPTTINQGNNHGILKGRDSQVNGLTIENTNINNTNGYGIYIYDYSGYGGWTQNLIIQNVNISGAGNHGIYVLTGNPTSQNIEITQTNISGRNGDGAHIEARGNINIHNNPASFTQNTGWGLYINGYDNPTLTLTQNRIENNGNGLYLQGISNLTLPGDNTIINNGGINYQLVDCNNITLENTSFNNTVRAYNTAVNASNCNNLILQNLTVSNNSGAAILVGGNDVILRDITINNSTGTSIQLQGTSYNMLMEHLTINQPQTVGIDIAGNVYTNNSEPALKITSNSNGPTTINQGHNHGILKGRDYQVNGLTIENTTINNTNGYGIYIYDYSGYGGWIQNLIIQNVNVSGAGNHGIYVLTGNPTSQNIEITQTSVTGRNGYGVRVEGRGNINIHDNPSSFSNNTGWGLYIHGYDNPTLTLTQNRIENNGNGLYLQGISNATIEDNISRNNAGTDFSSTADCHGNVVNNLSLGVNHPTTISFTYDDGISIKGVESAPANPDGYQNIGKYVDLMAVSGTSWIDIKVHYAAADVTNIDEDSLKMWKYNGSTWSLVPDPNGVNTADKYVYANGINSFSTFSAFAEKYTTDINVDPAEGFKGDTVDLTATLTADGNPLKNKDVDFYVDGTYVDTVTTNDDGIATLSYTITQDPGNYDIRAVFAGDDYYLGCENTSTLTVNKMATNLAVDDVNGNKGENVDLTATLTDEKGNPIKDKNVRFEVEGVEVGSNNTNDDGIATVSYNILQNPGTYTITAIFDGDDEYYGTENYADLTVNKFNSNIIADDVTGTVGDNVDLTATLTDDNGDPIIGKNVRFQINGADVGTAPTNGAGIATLSHNINENPGNHEIRAIFDGDEEYESSENTATLTVNKMATNMAVDDVTGDKSGNVNLVATLTNAHGDPINGENINFQINGTNVGTASTNSNGKATLSYNIIQDAGTYNITATFNEDNEHLGSQNTGTLTVTDQKQSDLYVTITSSKDNSSVGEKITLTFKVGNRGPDTAEDVVMTFTIPTGMEFVRCNVDQGGYTYDPSTRTITWTIGDVPVRDPYMWLELKILRTGTYLINPKLSTKTYDPTLNENTKTLTVNAVIKPTPEPPKVHGKTVGMQTTGIPLVALVLAVLMVLGGIATTKK